VIRRILIAEPNDDVRSLLEIIVRKLGFHPVAPADCHGRADADAAVIEPGSDYARSVLRRLGDDVPPVVCFSIYSRAAGFEPPQSVAYLLKPASIAAVGNALRGALAA
jgi:hypothetical protein